MTSLQPLYNALLIFTDGSSKGRAGYLINNQQVIIKTPGLSAQLAELTAVLNVFQSVNEAFNIFTDSLYVAQSIPLLETCGTFNFNTPAGFLFSQLQNIILARKHSFYLFFLKIYLFIICKYTVAVFRHTRRGSQILLRMVVSHHVVAGI